jgi:hypothetical protein
MVALAEEPFAGTARPDVELHVVGDDIEQEAVEHRVLKSIVTGSLIGAAVCALLWMGIVALAHLGSDWNLGPMLFVGLGCGIFAGLFLGGSAGALAGSVALEHYEKDHLPPRS